MAEDKKIFIIKKASHCSVITATFNNDVISPGDQFLHWKWNFFNGKDPLYLVDTLQEATHIQFEGSDVLYPVQGVFRWKGINAKIDNFSELEKFYHQKRKKEIREKSKRRFNVNQK